MPRRTPTWRKFPPARAFYFEGGYWLILWDFLYGAALYLFLLRFGWSAAMRNFAERATRFKPLQTFIYWSAFLMVTTILDAPLGLYEGYFRERQYGLATQTLLPWLGDQLIIISSRETRIRRNRGGGACRRGSPAVRHLVDLGRRCLHGLSDFHCDDCAGLDLPAPQ